MIDSNIMAFVSTVGFGGIAGFLIGFAIKHIMKILAVIAGVFFAALLYLESQHIVNIKWDKIQTISNGVLSAIATTTNATTTTGGGGVYSIRAILGSNSTTAATAILPITSMMANLGIPLTGSTAMGFTIGIVLSERIGESHFEEQHLEEENVKEILHDVLNELYYSKGKKERVNYNHRQ